ncbi:MAG TPA: SH3 domain-containing protein, partial [Aggregatilineaceae bacterium]|nr:SH3 domain-containing protein [Aggregatilineaceae bacterium]
MARKISLVLLLVALIVAAVPAQAQGANAWTVYQLNMRTGPAPTYDSVTALASNTGLILEARNEDASWVLGRTEDGVYRGWVSSLYLRFDTGFNSFNLPVSGEIVGTAPAAPAQPTAPEQPAPSGDAAGGSATVASTMNVRSGPGTTFGVIGQIRGGTQVILEGRNEAANWVLAHATDGAIRGWMFVQYLRFSGVTVTDLPVTGEIAESSESGIVAPTTNVNYNGVDMHGYDPARIEGIDLTQYPVVARATSRSRAIFQAGQALGNNSGVLAKIGDCSTEHWYFLKPFAWGDYNLGAYGSLQSTIDHFGDSLAYDSVASHNGFNANAVMAPEWSDPAYCQA